MPQLEFHGLGGPSQGATGEIEHRERPAIDCNVRTQMHIQVQI